MARTAEGRASQVRQAHAAKRESWFTGSPELIAAGVAELAATGAARSRGKWWAFEGFTSVDCCLRTERMTMYFEGKRTETLSKSTAWYPRRNQLVRNLEVAAQAPGDHPIYVLLITEPHGANLTDEHLQDSTPHLDDAGRAKLLSRYLGRCTWDFLCRQLGVGPLPHTSFAAKAADLCSAIVAA